MAWGGSLNKEGSNHLRNLREVDNILKFLEGFKRKLNEKEKQKIADAINIIVNHYSKEKKDENKT
ncbi:MAG: hypothetical protein HWN79_07130 [Candidatus Lokiarchaeota archaeon]|nr:hypothetical protein [Candidatus Lokiarchaeota archaeon]